MDYDDNDFQSQNFQLAGEDNSKFPSVLRSFALPSFDLEDHLQVHLRFDSLVEPGSLLGIPGQEENNWIESFSTGGSAIEFSSNAAESCSISRNNNVWSEATSSESVEMLLKSVGEDDMLENKTINEQPDSDNVLNSLSNTTTSLTTIVPVDSKMEGPRDADTATPPEKSHHSLPEIREDIVNAVSTVGGGHQTSIDEKPLSESSLDLVGCPPDDVPNNETVICLSATSLKEHKDQEEPSIDRKCLERTPEENSLNHLKFASHASDDSLTSDLNKTRSDTTHLNVHIDVGSSPAMSIMDVVAPEHSNAQKSNYISQEYGKVLPYETSSMLPYRQKVENQSLHSAVQIDEGNAIRSCIGASGNPSGSEEQKLEDPSIVLMEGFNELAYSRKSDGLLEVIVDQVKLTSRGDEVHSQILTKSKDKPFAMLDDVNNLKVDSDESNKEDISRPSSLLHEINTTAKVAKADVVGFHKGSTELVHEVDTAMVVMEEKHELGHCQSENSSDRVAVPKEKCHISSGEADEKQASETMEEKKPSDQESSVEALMEKTPDNILNSEGITNQPKELHYENVCPLETVMLELQTSSATGGSTKSCHIDSMVVESCDIRVSSSGATIIKKCPSVSPSPANAVSDCSLVTGMTQDSLVQAKDTSSATARDESFKREIVQEELDITDSSPNLTRLVPSGKSEHTHKLLSEETCVSDEFAVGNQSESSRLPSSKAILSHKSSQFSSGACNLQPASLHVRISDSEPNVLSTSGQLASIKTTKSSELQNSASAKVAVIPQNEFPPSTEKHTTLGCAIDGKVHPTVAAEVKEKGKYEEPTSRISGDTLHLKDNSGECDTSSKVDESLSVEAGNTNLSEHSCGSPNIISSVQHSHGERDGQGKEESADHIQTTSDDRHFITNTEKSTCETESTGGKSKESNVFADDKSFTFEVGQLPEHFEENAAKGWKPFSSPQFSEAPQSLQLASAKSVYDQCKSTEPGDISQLVSHEGESHNIGAKSAGVEKTRSSATVSVSRRKTKEKSISKKIAEKRESPSSTLASSFGTINRDLQLEGVRKHLPAEGTSMKSSSSLTVQASNLPDLNSSTTTALFNQPFTDSQQVQLRAQIFVYGSLIQGIPPDEACMVSAFGDVDGGRGRWEGVWHAVAEKYDNQKSPLAGCETPSRPVVKVPDQALRSSSLQSKVVSTPTSRTGNKGPATTSFSPVSMPSPVWSVPTRDKLQTNASRGSHLEPSPMLSTLQPFQPPHVRQYTGNSSPWLTPSPCAVPWVAPSHTSSLDISSKVSILPISETVQFTPPRDSSVSQGSNIQFLSAASALPATGYMNASTASAMSVDASKEVVSGRKKHASADQKSRRRKRGTAPETIVQMLPVSEPQLQLEPATGVSKLTCSSTHADISGRVSSGDLVSTSAPIISPTHFQVVGTGRTEPNIIFSEETYSKIEQAKLQAEAAASFAAATIRHSEGIWNQLATQKSSGIVSEVEQKLASAAVAAAAAAAVAKAASAAAKLSADSAVQAKLMADEAMMLGKTGRAPQSSESARQHGGDNLSRVTPASILKGKEKSNGSYSIIPAAREAARRRLEAASAATKRAENLDAIVKAAELAAEAVSQAGAIVAMGEPLPLSLSAILEGGPEGYWRAQHSKGELLVKTNITCGEKQSAFKQLSFNDKGRQETAAGEIVHCSTDLPRQSIENQTVDVSGIASPTIPVGEGGKDQLVVDLSENVIQEGSLVEVLSDVKGPGGVWYSGRVLNLKDSKAYVCYNELLNDEGSDKIKEWISLDHEDDRAPRIRVAHPVAAKKSEGPRKRRRAAAGMHSWNTGDRVDAWINDGWREGVITEKSDEDLTKFIIHFPAGGDTSVVRSWDLRPSLVWREGQWIELSCSQKSILEHHEGDTPMQKRRKISRPEAKINSEVQALGVSRVSRNLRSDDSRKPQDFLPLPLSAKEKDFSLGKAREENNSDRVKRTGLQKEGSRVVFGIPKPGKKRKFMDVSKHCVVENTEKTRETSESVKFAKYLMPQSSTGWKNVPKVDSRSKRSVDLKPKVFKSAKSRNVQTRSLADKGNSLIPILSSSNGEGNSRGTLTSSKPSYSHVDSRIEKKNVPEVGLYANKMGTVEGPVSVSHLHSTPNVPFVNKSTFDVEAEKGKDSHAMENSTTNEERCSNFSSKVTPDATEPRRSNRRIQPTSRLLEGLQSSLMVPKIPSVSHDKGLKVSHRTVSSSRGHTRS